MTGTPQARVPGVAAELNADQPVAQDEDQPFASLRSPCIVRRDPNTKLFPPVTPSLYTPPVVDDALAPYAQRLAHWLLLLAQRPFRQLRFRSKLSLEDKFARLLSLHRRALEMELAGRFPEADYLWRETYWRLSELARLPVPVAQQLDPIATAAVPPADDEAVEPGVLLRRVIEEVFIDTHCAFYNGHARTTVLEADDRAFAHAQYLRWILSPELQLGVFSPEEITWHTNDLVRPPLEAQLIAYLQAGKWKHAVSVSGGILQLAVLSGHNSALVACALVGDTLADLKRAHERSLSGYLRDANRLHACLSALDRVHEAAPTTTATLPLIGRVHALRGARLAQAQRMGDALLHIRHAVTIAPELAGMPPIQLLVAYGTNVSPPKPSPKLEQTAAVIAAELGRQIEQFLAIAAPVAEPTPLPGNAPVLVGNKAIPPQPAATFYAWLRSPFDRRLKGTLAAALLIVLLTGSLSLWQWRIGSVRDAAFTNLVQAASSGDDRSVLLGAEGFLANPPIGRRDARRQQVLDLYSRSFVGWFRANYTAPPADFQERVNRYRTFVVNNP